MNSQQNAPTAPKYHPKPSTVHPALAEAAEKDVEELKKSLVREGESDDGPFKVIWLEEDSASYMIDGICWDCPRVTLCLAPPQAPSYLRGIPLELELVYLPMVESLSSCGASPALGPVAMPPLVPPPLLAEQQQVDAGVSSKSPTVVGDGRNNKPVMLTPVIRARVTSCCFHSFVDQESGVILQDEVQQLFESIETEKSEGGGGEMMPVPSAPFVLDSAVNVVKSVLVALAEPRVATIRPMQGMPRDTMLAMWKFHAGGNCPNCPLASILPATWEDFNSIKGDDEKEQLMRQFSENLRNFHLQQAQSEAAFLAKRQDDVRNAQLAYVPRTHALFEQAIPPGSKLWRWSSKSPSSSSPHQRESQGAVGGDDTPPLRASGIIDPALLHYLSTHDDISSSPEAAEHFRTHFCREDSDHVFSFPFLTEEFCKLLVEEVKHYEATPGMPRFRPNSMNRYGLILNEVGLRPLVNALCKQFIFPIAQALFPEQLKMTVDHDEEEVGRGAGEAMLDSHHTFVVEYRQDADIFLDMHADDSEITLNVNLLDEFEGSSLCFCGMAGTSRHRKHSRSYAHEKGRAVVHPGALRHGALPITSGERMNLIVWCRSTWLRQNYPERGKKHAFSIQEEQPDLVCLSATHDPDYKHWSDSLQAE